MPSMAQIFIDLPNTKKAEIRATLIDIGLCMVNDRPYQHILLKGKNTSIGKLNKIYFQLSKLSKVEMDGVIDILIAE